MIDFITIIVINGCWHKYCITYIYQQQTKVTIMNSSINYSGFNEMFLDSNDDFEPYGCSETNDSLEKIYNSIQAYKAGFNDREYSFDD